MRLSVVLGFATCFLLPFQRHAASDIFQPYVILNSGSGDQFLAAGLNADGATAFAGTALGDFTPADVLVVPSTDHHRDGRLPLLRRSVSQRWVRWLHRS